MANRLEVRTVIKVTLTGDQWECVASEAEQLIGFRAMGDKCTVLLYNSIDEPVSEVFDVDRNRVVLMQNGLMVVPQGEDQIRDDDPEGRV